MPASSWGGIMMHLKARNSGCTMPALTAPAARAEVRVCSHVPLRHAHLLLRCGLLARQRQPPRLQRRQLLLQPLQLLCLGVQLRAAAGVPRSQRACVHACMQHATPHVYYPAKTGNKAVNSMGRGRGMPPLRPYPPARCVRPGTVAPCRSAPPLPGLAGRPHAPTWCPAQAAGRQDVLVLVLRLLLATKGR